jgi:CRP/FNR family cyclic AMP-dependent transcriptional regulator
LKSPYGLDIIEDCLTCTEREHYLFCNLPKAALEMLERIKSVASYPKGALLFMEGQEPRGVFILCHGRVKLSSSSSDGKTVILRIAEAGEVLGLGATVADHPYDTSAELLEPAQANFIRAGDFLDFLSKNGEAAVRVARQLSKNYHSACQEVRSLGLSQSASEKLARLILEWSATPGEHVKQSSDIRVQMTLTHEEIAQLIGTSRETVTRMMSDFKKKKLIETKGATLVLRNKPALEKMVK